jgi:hypothetical protein
MSATSSSVPHSSSFSWGAALAAVSILTIGGGAIIWANRDAPSSESAQAAQSEIVGSPSRFIPSPPPPIPVEVQSANLHSIAYGVENGTAVVKIKVVAEGDELIIDAATGRLIETRPSRPSAPPPMGKFAAPFAPIM